MITRGRGVLDRPVKPGDDSLVACDSNRHCERGDSNPSAATKMDCFASLAMTNAYSCPSSVSPPETSTLPGAGSRLSFLTTPSSISIE